MTPTEPAERPREKDAVHDVSKGDDALQRSTPGSPPAHPVESEKRRWRDRIDPDDWQWRQRLRNNPRTRGPYRAGVGVLGGFLILLAGLTGWLPGPGGIPLALLGLAVLATEFAWATRLLHKCERAFDRFVAWSSSLSPVWRWLGAFATIVGVLLVIWCALVLLSVPQWAPNMVAEILVDLPGVDAAAD